VVKQPAYSDPGKPGTTPCPEGQCLPLHLPSADLGCPEQGYSELSFMQEVERHRQEQYPAGLPAAKGGDW